MAIKLTSKHFNSQILFFFYLHISILQHAQARNKATPVKADQCGRAIVPRESDRAQAQHEKQSRLVRKQPFAVLALT